MYVCMHIYQQVYICVQICICTRVCFCLGMFARAYINQHFNIATNTHTSDVLAERKVLKQSLKTKSTFTHHTCLWSYLTRAALICYFAAVALGILCRTTLATVHVCMYVYLHSCMHTCMYVCMYVCMHVSVFVYMHVRILKSVRQCIYVHI